MQGGADRTSHGVLVHAAVAAAAALCHRIPSEFRESRRGARGRAKSGRPSAIIIHAFWVLTGGETPPSNVFPAPRIRLPRSRERPARGVIAAIHMMSGGPHEATRCHSIMPLRRPARFTARPDSSTRGHALPRNSPGPTRFSTARNGHAHFPALPTGTRASPRFPTGARASLRLPTGPRAPPLFSRGWWAGTVPSRWSRLSRRRFYAYK